MYPVNCLITPPDGGPAEIFPYMTNTTEEQFVKRVELNYDVIYFTTNQVADQYFTINPETKLEIVERTLAVHGGSWTWRGFEDDTQPILCGCNSWRGSIVGHRIHVAEMILENLANV